MTRDITHWKRKGKAGSNQIAFPTLMSMFLDKNTRETLLYSKVGKPDNVLISAMERYALKGARTVLWGRRDKSRTYPTHSSMQRSNPMYIEWPLTNVRLLWMASSYLSFEVPINVGCNYNDPKVNTRFQEWSLALLHLKECMHMRYSPFYALIESMWELNMHIYDTPPILRHGKRFGLQGR